MKWSAEIPFTQEQIMAHVPIASGVYQILQAEEHSRYKGMTRILKIGESATNLRQEILNHFQRHTIANRLRRIEKQSDVKVSVVFARIDECQTTKDIEQELLRCFEDEHWDLPVLNSQRGYARGEDAHYRQ